MPGEISMREVYDLVLELRVEVHTHNARSEGAFADISDHELRIRGLERWIWRASGIAAALGAAAGAIVANVISTLIH